MLISIITINYNNDSGLEKTIQSIIQQDYPNIEYIIIDGNSADNSIDVIRKYESQIAYWVSEKDNGVYNAMNKGIAKSNGDYILFINSGDYIVSKDVVNKMLDTEDGTFDLLYGNLERTFPDGKKDIVNMPTILDPFFLLNASLCHPVTLIKRNLFDRYGLYDESFKIVADWAFFVKVLLAGNASAKHKSINIAMFHMNGMSSLLSNQPIILEERKRAINLYLSPLTQKSFNDLKYYKKQYSKAYYALGHKIEQSTKQLLKKIKPPFAWLGNHTYTYIKCKLRSAHTNSKLKKCSSELLLHCQNIPIIINNRNRLTYLKRLISSLEKRGYTNIYIIDNASSYIPLLEYYKEIPYKVFKLNKNIGHCALWDTDIYDQFKNDYYVYTDSDVEIIKECPDNFMAFFYVLLNKYSDLGKVGFSIKIDDLPNHYKMKNQVLAWEKKFYTVKKESLAYKADIDTTFALYKPNSFKNKFIHKALRTAYPYQIKHLPWYEDSNALTEEQVYYYQHIKTSTHWSNLMLPKK